MKNRLPALFGILILLLTSARAADSGSAQQLFEAISSADSIELLRLDPSPRNIFGKLRRPDTAGTIDGRKILSSQTTRDHGDIVRLAASLRHSVESADSEVFALCFNPRHALRLRIGATERTVVVCFECLAGYAKGIPQAESFHLSPGAEADWEAVFAKYEIRSIRRKH